MNPYPSCNFVLLSRTPVPDQDSPSLCSTSFPLLNLRPGTFEHHLQHLKADFEALHTSEIEIQSTSAQPVAIKRAGSSSTLHSNLWTSPPFAHGPAKLSLDKITSNQPRQIKKTHLSPAELLPSRLLVATNLDYRLGYYTLISHLENSLHLSLFHSLVQPPPSL